MLKRVSIAAAMMLTGSAANASVQFVIYGAAYSDRSVGGGFDLLQHYIVIHANDTQAGQSIPFSEFGQSGTYSFTSASLSISLGSSYSYNLTFRPIALDRSSYHAFPAVVAQSNYEAGFPTAYAALELWHTSSNLVSDNAHTYYYHVSRVPEPASWAMMVAGFGAIGCAMRGGRKTAVRFA